jgi:hypothetical protein
MEHISLWSTLKILILWLKTNIIKKNREVLLDTSKEVDLQMNMEQSMYSYLVTKMQNKIII